MSEGSQVSSFQPTEAWHADWPYGVSTSVQVQACVAGPAAARAVKEFLKPLKQDPDADVPEGANLYYWGGFTAEVTPPVEDGVWRIVVASAGEDGFDSVQDGADAVVAALEPTPGAVRLTWHELPAARVGRTH